MLLRSNKFSGGFLVAAIVAAVAVGHGSAWADSFSNLVIENTAGGQVVGSASDDTDSTQHALVWLATGTLVDLAPAGYTNSGAAATNGTQQVGAAKPATATNGAQAVMWSGTAGSVVNLNPDTGYEIATAANGISPDGGQQVGDGYGSATNYNANALLWNGTAASVVNLQPATGYDRSFAQGTDGTHQVGYGGVPNASSYNAHALLWSGTAASVVDLHPASGFTDSFAQGVSGTQQVGYGYVSGGTFAVHALLWTGTAASAVDLNPAGYNGSYAYSTNGTSQVGYGQDATFKSHALLWSGDAASVVDLAALLPGTGPWTFSVAYNIDDSGDIFGWANGDWNGVTDKYAIEWSPTAVASFDGMVRPDTVLTDPTYTATVLYELVTPVPEPASLAVLAIGGIGLVISGRTRRRAR